MSIARAFTTKRANRDSPDAHQRSLTTKQPFSSGSIRNKISSPVGLISTTNMLSYNAPDIFPSSTSPNSSSHSASDASDSDHKSISSVSTPPSSPDTEKGSPEPNHLSCYFHGPTSSLSSTKSTSDLKESSTAPRIPSRAPSHTKHSHESLSHKKTTSKSSSLNHKSSAPVIGNRTSASAIRTSYQIFNLQSSAAANSKSNNHSSSSSTTVTPLQIDTKQSSISQESQIASITKMPRPAQVQGLPSKPNQQTPPMLPQPQIRSKSKSRSRSASASQPQAPHAQCQVNQNHSSLSSESSQVYSPSPFSKELAQVTELAEEYSGGKEAFVDEEMRVMAQKGLCRFGAEDYIGEIRGLWSLAFGDGSNSRGWSGGVSVREVEKSVGGGMGAMWI